MIILKNKLDARQICSYFNINITTDLKKIQTNKSKEKKKTPKKNNKQLVRGELITTGEINKKKGNGIVEVQIKLKDK